MIEWTMEDVKIVESIGPDGGARVEISSPKFKAPFVIRKAGYTGTMFEVQTSGKQSAGIHGMFTTVDDAKNTVLQHIRTSKPSKAVVRDKKWEERNAARLAKKSGGES